MGDYVERHHLVNHIRRDDVDHVDAVKATMIGITNEHREGRGVEAVFSAVGALGRQWGGGASGKARDLRRSYSQIKRGVGFCLGSRFPFARWVPVRTAAFVGAFCRSDASRELFGRTSPQPDQARSVPVRTAAFVGATQVASLLVKPAQFEQAHPPRRHQLRGCGEGDDDRHHQ